ncbi:MAG: hypothetical protein RL758_1255 [Pseudomonadota bacterium]|jgi:uncharacterized ferritin-like protein (DUF455 family)
MELRHLALQAFATPDPDEKTRLVNLWRNDKAAFHLDAQAQLCPANDQPGRPEKPQLIHPGKVPKRSPHTLAGRAALMHAIAHIEFNAIALALDAVWRFSGMPESYYQQWMQVAVEEAYHFGLVRDRLAQMGCRYGDHTAHDGLWEMCEHTKHDITARMALVPRTLEARGLDATPIIQAKLQAIGTPDAKACMGILDIILRDEIGHVAVGNHWYRWLCERKNLEPLAHYSQLLVQYDAPVPKPPYNLRARERAGFTPQELSVLQEGWAP